MSLPEKEPGFWVALLAWIRSQQIDFSYASLAALFSLLRIAKRHKNSYIICSENKVLMSH
ncbi:hypothetical protein GWK90_04105 [Candidatus Hamiltonella defensa]|nr:phage holin family protein [Candidatus Hamiltonella defensa]MBK4361475.1 hypothetical protein [Candidatus Hamiltonella defensa]